jgi:alanyl-tRNA synthetase
MALFGEKYGDMVRVVEIGPRSLELCGGTHVRRSGDIGFVSISHEASIAAGVRRIECVAGRAAHAALLAQQREEAALASLLKTKSGHIADKVERLQERVRTLEAELERAKAKIASSSAQDIAGSARKTTRGITLVTHTVEASDPGTLRSMVDSLRVKIGSGVVVLAGNTGDSSILVAGVTADLTSSVSAGALIKAAAESAGGKGGGRPDFAQAGGIPNDRVPTALNKIVELLS